MPRAAAGTAFQFPFDFAGLDFQQRRTTIDHTAYGRAMAFAKSRYPEQLSKSVM
jgi:hypothetical protein